MSRRRTSTTLVTQQQQLAQLKANLGALASRLDFQNRLLASAFQGKRQYNDIFGYPDVLNYRDFLAWYQRGGIAKPIIDLPIQKCWSTPPTVQEDQNQFNETPFENSWKELTETLPVYAIMKRAHTLAWIGRYAVILVGVRRNNPLSDPLELGSLRSIKDIAYLAPYSEDNAKILDTDWNGDPTSPRFGKPEYYEVNLGSPSFNAQVKLQSRTQKVHWSRIIHIADGCLEDEFYGTPRLQALINHFHDLMKSVGGGAEIFWLNARAGLKIKVDEGRSFSEDQAKQAQDDAELMANQLKRVFFADGVDIQTLLNNQPIDPRGTVEPIMQQICAAGEIPKRILIGSEQGEQASTQDRINFAEVNMARQASFCGPGIVLNAVKHLIMLGALPTPKNGPFCIWEPLLKLDEQQRAAVVLNRAQAAQEWAAHPEVVTVYAPGEFRQDLGLDAEMSPEMKKTIDEYRLEREKDLPDPTPQAPSKRGMPGEPAINVVVPEVAPAVTKDELFALENRLTTALRSMSSETPRPFINFDKSREIREQLTALTQQVQTALLKNASETQLTALAQRVEACLQQLLSLQPQAPPVVNINIPEGAVRVSVPAPQVTVQQAKKTKEVIERDEHREITSIVREVIE